jgi:hypothetical protein
MVPIALAANMVERRSYSLAPEEERARLLAAKIAHIGRVFLEKSGAVEGDSDMTH